MSNEQSGTVEDGKEIDIHLWMERAVGRGGAKIIGAAGHGNNGSSLQIELEGATYNIRITPTA